MERLEIEILAGVSGLEKSLNQAQDKLQKFGQAAEQLGSTLSKVLTLPIAGLGAASLKAFGDIQSLKNGLTAVTGSAEVASAQFVRLQKLAKLPGLGLNEVAKGAINLQVIGFTAERAEASMLAFGNAVATVGKGKAEFERAIYGLQQLANTDFPLGEDLNILKDAIPQITPLLKDAFGTARSDELQKLGITSAQVVDTIITGLSKLPPVTGGINGAFENLGDGVKTNLAEIGESINSAFDVSAIIDAFIDKLSAITAAFRGLSPQAQKIIIIIAGILAAMGPLLLTIGVFTTSVIPALTAGLTLLSGAFLAITGPIALIIAAVAGAAYLIVKYWDDIVAYFTSGPGVSIFDALQETFTAFVSWVKVIWAGITKTLSAIWDSWGGTIITIAKAAWDSVMKVFNLAFTIIGNTLKIGTAVLTGDWAAIGPILLNTTKRVWNAIVAIIGNAIQATAGLVGKFLEFVGLDGVSQKVNDITEAVKRNLSFDIPVSLDVQDTATKVTNKASEVLATVVETKVKTLEKSSNKVKEIYADLARNLDKNSVDFGVEDARPGAVKAYQKAIEALIDNGYKPESAAIQDLIAKQEALNDIRRLGMVGIAQSAPAGPSIPKALEMPVLKSPIPDLTSQMEKDFNALASVIVTNGVGEAFAEMGASIGQTLANGGSLISALGSTILSAVGSIATELGKAAIKIGVGMISIKAAFKNPATAIAAGVALVALGAFISSKVANIPSGNSNASGGPRNAPMPQFANGGIVSGPTVGLMGEYAGARSNPEVIAPLNKLKGMLPAGENSVIIPDLKLRGEDIFVSFKRTSKRMGKLG